jgi:hypothetical protein
MGAAGWAHSRELQTAKQTRKKMKQLTAAAKKQIVSSPHGKPKKRKLQAVQNGVAHKMRKKSESKLDSNKDLAADWEDEIEEVEDDNNKEQEEEKLKSHIESLKQREQENENVFDALLANKEQPRSAASFSRNKFDVLPLADGDEAEENEVVSDHDEVINNPYEFHDSDEEVVEEEEELPVQSPTVSAGIEEMIEEVEEEESEDKHESPELVEEDDDDEFILEPVEDSV